MGPAALPRHPWHKLPPAVLEAVEARTGPIKRAIPVEAGSVSDVAVVLETYDSRFFCKGASSDNPRGWMHRNEARINAFLPPQVPRLQWQVETDGWLLLGFEHVQGRHPDLRPGSADLPALAATLTTMAAALTPSPAKKVQAATARWADRIAPEVVDGDTLVHTDVSPHNFLVHDTGVAIVDWSMPCRGAAWIDSALMVVRLIRAGHSPDQAEDWANQMPAWRTADTEAVDAFAAGIASLSRERQLQQPSVEHLGPLADAANRWTSHRQQRPHDSAQALSTWPEVLSVTGWEPG
ncbi:phosphotransferase [Actinoplanes sp. CA-131856]